MALSRIASLAASTLPVMGIALALANWNAKPGAAWAWAAAIAMFLVMVAVRQGFQLAFRHSSTFTQYMKRMFRDSDAGAGRDADIVSAALGRTIATVNNGVVFGALMMIIPLSMTLAHAYGFVDDPHSLNRLLSIVSGVYLVVMGNAMPRALPPVASMQDHGAGVQAFQRFVGWTWVLCGVGFVTAWLALPIAAAPSVSMTLVGAAMMVTVLQFLRLVRKTRQHAPGVN